MSATAPAPRAWWATAPLPGAIGILHLEGSFEEILEKIAGGVPRVGSTTLATLASIDEGIVARPEESSVLLMPHGGPHIRRLLSEAVVAAGAEFIDVDELDPRTRWPEANTLVEACMLDALARTGSPRAVNLLLAQPELHAKARERGWSPDEHDLQRARILERLIDPPLIAIVGVPNVGKSTLLNRLAGREVAITADLAGTTRDTVTARVELDGVSCDLVDLPGERPTQDPIEGHALALARTFLREADHIVAVVDPEHPDPPELDRTPDITVSNKADLGSVPGLFPICALDGSGIEEFATELRRLVVPDDLLSEATSPWLLHPSIA